MSFASPRVMHETGACSTKPSNQLCSRTRIIYQQSRQKDYTQRAPAFASLGNGAACSAVSRGGGAVCSAVSRGGGAACSSLYNIDFGINETISVKRFSMSMWLLIE